MEKNVQSKVIYVGIDPGKNGGLCINFFGSIVCYKFDPNEYIKALKKTSDYKVKVGLELVHSMPKQGVKSTFSFGENFGYIRGILETLSLDYELVTPQEWKKHFDLLKTDKKESCSKADELGLDQSYFITKRGALKDGICDAYLIMKYIESKDKE